MKNSDIDVEHLANIKSDTNPQAALDAAYALCIFLLQQKHVFPTDELQDVHNASVYLSKVREARRERNDERVRARFVQ